jgi:hypothetical protein
VALAVRSTHLETPLPARVRPSAPPDERAARHALREQVARLEAEMAQLFSSAWPRTDVVTTGRSRRGGESRLLSLTELEELRDGLVVRVRDMRRALDERGEEEERNRRLLEEMLLDPRGHAWIELGNEDIGEPGCRHWHARPRFGLLGMLMRWWRVVVSSGCPLPAPPVS